MPTSLSLPCTAKPPVTDTSSGTTMDRRMLFSSILMFPRTVCSIGNDTASASVFLMTMSSADSKADTSMLIAALDDSLISSVPLMVVGTVLLAFATHPMPSTNSWSLINATVAAAAAQHDTKTHTESENVRNQWHRRRECQPTAMLVLYQLCGVQTHMYVLGFRVVACVCVNRGAECGVSWPGGVTTQCIWD